MGNNKNEPVVTPFDDETVSAPTDEVVPVELDITNPAHGNLTYEELQAGKLNKTPELTYEEKQALENKKGQK